MSQIGFAHIQPVGCMLPSGQLKDVRYQCCHTHAEDMDACTTECIQSILVLIII